jgi:RNA polymerase sigma factor for flagellar operon FliA
MVVTAKWMSVDDLPLLWREYKQTNSVELRNQLVELHLGFVKIIVSKLMGKAFAKLIGRDEIEAAGNFGLIEAVERFEPERQIKFETYAPARIRGAILDWLRDLDWVPRLVRSNTKLYQKTVAAIQDSVDRQPTVEDVADYLHIPHETAAILKRDAESTDYHVYQAGDRIRGDEDSFGGMPAFDELPDRRTPLPDELSKPDRFGLQRKSHFSNA